MKIKYAMLAIVFAAVASTASAVDFHGYFRDGPGWNSKGSTQVCFQAPGTDFKFRLGNECDHYLEMEFSQSLYKDANGVEWKYTFMPAVWNPNTNGYGNSLGVAQNWSGVTLPSLGGATIWAGSRYYQRHDIHSIDYFWWNALQGKSSVGIENIDAGFGKFSLAVGRSNEGSGASKSASYMIVDARLGGIQVASTSTIEFGVDVALAMDQNNELGANRAGASPMFTAIWNLDKVLGGGNTLAFQYMAGAYHGDSNGLDAGATSDPKQIRGLDQLVFAFSPDFDGALVLMYQYKDPGTTGAITTNTMTAELRPAYHFNDYFKFAVDLGYQAVSPSQGDSVSLYKITLAPTIVAGRGYWARPELRFFMTYAGWNDAAAAVGGPPGQGVQPVSAVYGADKSGLTFGAQVEAWF